MALFCPRCVDPATSSSPSCMQRRRRTRAALPRAVAVVGAGAEQGGRPRRPSKDKVASLDMAGGIVPDPHRRRRRLDRGRRRASLATERTGGPRRGPPAREAVPRGDAALGRQAAAESRPRGGDASRRRCLDRPRTSSSSHCMHVASASLRAAGRRPARRAPCRSRRSAADLPR